MESFKDLIHTMEFEPYKLKRVERADLDFYDKERYSLRKDLDEKDEKNKVGEKIKVGEGIQSDEKEGIEFIIDEITLKYSSGIVKREYDSEYDIMINLLEVIG